MTGDALQQRVTRPRGTATRVVAGAAPERIADIELLLDLVAGGDLTVVHDGSYDLEHIVDAYRRVDSGHKRGNVIVHPSPAAHGAPP